MKIDIQVDAKMIDEIKDIASKVIIADEVRILALVVAMAHQLEGAVTMPYHIRKEYLWALDRLSPKRVMP